MRHPETIDAEFVKRHNRFLASVRLGGETVKVHVKNTGRLTEILVPGARTVLTKADSPGRKTAYDMVAAYKGDMLISLDSQVPNAAFAEALPRLGIFEDITDVRGEVTKGDSRFDFMVEADGRKNYMEIKGVALEEDGTAMFPGAPTTRGTKHVRGLEAAAAEGFGAYVVFIVQMSPVGRFTPNYDMDPDFCDALVGAAGNGVEVLAFNCDVTRKGVRVDRPVPVIF